MRLNERRIERPGPSIVLLKTFGFLFLIYAAVYNEFLWRLVRFQPLGVIRTYEIRMTQLISLIIGCTLLVLSRYVQSSSRLAAFAHKPLFQRFLLSVLTVFTVVTVTELSLNPFVHSPTSIFEEDDELGWKLKPNAEGVWGKELIKVNGKGLIGPELDYMKKEGAYRILYLGDSVTFGYRLDDYKKGYPFVTEFLLEQHTGHHIETINSGVGGYSPWQEYVYLQREGIKYSPDLVVIGFVLNDVTEKFTLARFGGTGKGWQVMNATPIGVRRWIFNSSIIIITVYI